MVLQNETLTPCTHFEKQKRATVCKDRAETSGLMEAEPCSELAGGDMRKDKVKKDKKKNNMQTFLGAIFAAYRF
jgi:hypothetical protein